MDEKIMSRAEENKPKRTKRERHKLSYYFTAGVFMSLLDKLTNAIYSALSGGLFGKIFTAYSSEQQALEKGYLREHMMGSGKLRKYSRTARGAVSEKIENGFFTWAFGKLGRFFLSTPLKIYGNFLLTFGLYTVFAYFARRFTEFTAAPDYNLIIFGAILILVSIPLLMSRESLGTAIGWGRSSRAIFVGSFGFRDETFEVPANPTKFRANAAIVLGMICGTLALFVDPMRIIAMIALFVLIALIMITPEIGVLLSLFVLPFLSFTSSPSIMLGLLMALISVSTLVKLVRGKRIIKIELLDVVILIFMVAFFMSGAVSAGGAASLSEVLLCCTLLIVYFLIANMMRTELWIKRCVIALVSSASVVAVIGVVEYFFGELSIEWIDTAYFSDIPGRVVSLFDNSNVLAFYLAMIFPFALNLFFRSKNRREKFIMLFSNIAIILCIVFTFSRGAWIAVILSTAVYLFIRTRRSLKTLLAFCFAIPILPLIIPSSIVNRFLSIGDMADSSTFYRVYTWRGALRAISDNILGGIGYGNAAFEEVYPKYAYAGIESAAHAHSLYLQILLGMGIVGFIVFCIVMLFFSQKSFDYIKRAESSGSACYVASALSSMVAALVMGAFDHIWYNYRIFFIFWAVMGIAVATIRVGEAKTRLKNDYTVSDGTSANVDLFFG